MEDSPSNPSIPAPPPSLLRRRRVWPFLVGLAVLGAVGALGWWAIAGSKFWTDGAALHVNDNEARIREVVWTPPIPLTVFNTTDQEYEPSISPDGDELYFVRGKAGQNPEPGHNADIYVSYRRMGAWTPPAPVDAINSDYDDLGPRVTADSKFLLFYSNRPGGLGGYDIWAAPRLPSDGTKPGGWGKPFNLGPGVNSEFDEYNPDPSPDGQRLFFATNRKAASREQKQAWRATIRAGTNADFDLWYAVRNRGAESSVAVPTLGATTRPALEARVETQPSDETAPGAKAQAANSGLVFNNAVEVPGVNTTYAEGASCMSPAGDFLYFASDRPGGYGKFDIYRCRVGPDGIFGPVENLGPAINTSDNETDPQLALNGFRLYFSSDRHTGDSAGAPTTMPSAGSAASTSLPQASSAQVSSGPASAVEDGRYSLLQSESREVYSIRAGHRLPHLGLSWLVLGLSLLALIPLLMFMRKWDDQRLSLIQKCLLVSLLVHLLITLGLSMKKVTTDVIHYVRQEQGLEPPVDLTLTLNGPAGRGDDVGAAVRQQTSSDLPTTPAPPAAPVQQIPGAEALEAPAMPAGMQAAVPQAGLGAPAVTIQVEAPKIQTPKLDAAAGAPKVVPSVVPQAPGLDLKLDAVAHVSQAEAPRQIAPAAVVPAARVGEVGIEPKIDVPQVNADAKSAPAAVQAGSMVESAVAARPAAPSVNVAGPRAAPLSPDAAVAIETPRPAVAPVASRAPESPAVAEVSNAAARQATAPPIETGANPASVHPAVPTAEAAANSLAGGAAPHAMPSPAEVAAGGANAAAVVQPNAGTAAEVGSLANPRPAAGKVSGSEVRPAAPSLPEVARQAVAEAPGGGTPSAHPVEIPGASSKVPTAEAAAGSLAGGAAPHAMPTPAEVAAGAAAAVVQPNAGSTSGVGDLAAPKSTAGKVTGTEAAAVAAAIPVAEKQGTPNPLDDNPAARSASLAGAVSRVPTAHAVTDSLAGASAPHSSPAATAVATGTPAPNGPALPANADLSVRPASQLPGPAAGPLASNHPDSPQPAEILAGASRAGDASGPGGAAILPQVAVPTSAAPAGAGSNQSLASAPTPAGSAAAGSPANSPAVQATSAANLSAGPAVAAAPATGGPKAVSSGQPDAPAAAEAANALARHGSPGAATQPALVDANSSSVAGAKVPTVTGAPESLAAAPDARSGVADVVGTPAQRATPVAPGGVQSPLGNVEVASRAVGAIRSAEESRPSASEAAPMQTGPSARAGADTGAVALAESGPAGLTLPAQPAGAQKSASGVTAAVAPTTRPLDTSTAVALARSSAAASRGMGDFAATPQVGSPAANLTPLARLAEASAAARAADVNAATKKLDGGPSSGSSVAAAAVAPAGAPAVVADTAAKPGSTGQSLASAAMVSPREVVAGPPGKPAGATMAATPMVGVSGPNMVMPKVVIAPVATPAAGPANSPGAAGSGSMSVRRAQSTPGGGDGRPVAGVMLASADVPGISNLPLSASTDPAGKSLDSAASKTMPRTVSGPPVAAPEVTIAVPKLTAPESLFQRSTEQRKPLVEKRGGTPESEGAVERALAYLSRQQEPDGRWTVFNDDGRPGHRGAQPHDMACTGLATLAFLTADHTPAKEGPYRETVSKAIEFLIGLEGADGDLRGPRRFRGGGADQANMYDQGICTMALSEAALMTGDRRYTEAALRAAQFIIKSQNPQGGWRYTPAEAGDTSVLGWQMLALHDAEQLGFQVPEQAKARAEKYLKSVSQGKTRILASYMPGESPTSAMTAEALFARLLLGDEITGAETKEVCEFLTRELPQSGGADFYFWYYASLSLSQMPDLIKAGARAGSPEARIAADAWKKWNSQTRDTLIRMQKKDGPGDGSWADSRWGERGGRAFTTSLATLTLEVYYRYLPLRVPADNDDAAPDTDPRRAAAEIKASKPAPGKANAPGKQRGKGWDDAGGHYPGVEPN